MTSNKYIDDTATIESVLFFRRILIIDKYIRSLKKIVLTKKSIIFW